MDAKTSSHLQSLATMQAAATLERRRCSVRGSAIIRVGIPFAYPILKEKVIVAWVDQLDPGPVLLGEAQAIILLAVK